MNTNGMLGVNHASAVGKPSAVYMGGVLSGKSIVKIACGFFSCIAYATVCDFFKGIDIVG
jgi:hypothetical protein